MRFFLFKILFLGLTLSVNVFSQENPDSITDSVRLETTTVNGNLECIVPPTGFEISRQFNGYINNQISSAITIQEILGANFIHINEALNSDYISSLDLQHLGSEDFQANNGIPGKIHRFQLYSQEIAITRVMLIAGKLDKTVWINVSYPTKFEDVLYPRILESLKTLKL